MRWWIFLGLQAVLIIAAVLVVRLHDDHAIVLKKPPASLAQWYKPQNKRQVWLHTMFKLRREMQAANAYAVAEDAKNLGLWMAKLDKDYRKMADMVPEWTPRLDLAALDAALAGAEEKNFAKVTSALSTVGETCRSCHADFRAVTAALYRAPDFSAMKVAGQPLAEHMDGLTRHVNDIKIAYGDGRDADAREAFAKLQSGMAELGQTCDTCHKKLGKKAFPDAATAKAMASLEAALYTDNAKAKGRALGTVAVLACAQCHGTHRISGDLRQLFDKDPDWGSLLQHKL